MFLHPANTGMDLLHDATIDCPTRTNGDPASAVRSTDEHLGSHPMEPSDNSVTKLRPISVLTASSDLHPSASRGSTRQRQVATSGHSGASTMQPSFDRGFWNAERAGGLLDACLLDHPQNEDDAERGWKSIHRAFDYATQFAPCSLLLRAGRNGPRISRGVCAVSVIDGT